MKDNRNTFPKLETGMVVCVKGQIEFGLGPYLVVGERALAKSGWIRLDSLEQNGTYTQDPDFDVICVYSLNVVFSLDFDEYLPDSELIWKLKEQCPTQAKIAELEETIKKASQQIQQLKGEINV